MVTGTQDSPRGRDLLDHHCMEERARLKALEALCDPTTTARIVALPAAGEVVIAVEASPVSQYDRMMISGTDGYRRHLPAIMGTEGVGRAIAVGNAANDAVEQALSTTRRAELVRGGYICLNLEPTRTCVILRSDDHG